MIIAMMVMQKIIKYLTAVHWCKKIWYCTSGKQGTLGEYSNTRTITMAARLDACEAELYTCMLYRSYNWRRRWWWWWWWWWWLMMVMMMMMMMMMMMVTWFVTRSDIKANKVSVSSFCVIDTNRKCNERALIWYVSKLGMTPKWSYGLLKVRVVVEWPFWDNGAERIDSALVKVDFCHLKHSKTGWLRAFKETNQNT